MNLIKIATVVALMFCGACQSARLVSIKPVKTALYVPSTTSADEGSINDGFTGLKDRYESQAPLKILQSHGMSNHPFGAEKNFATVFGNDVKTYRDLIQVMTNEVSRVRQRESFVAAVEASSEVSFQTNLVAQIDTQLVPIRTGFEWLLGVEGQVDGYLYQRVFANPISGREVQFIYANWGVSAIQDKVAAFYDPANEALRKRQACANKWLKDGVISWGLSDASRYVGRKQDAYEKVVLEGFRVLTKDVNDSAPIDLVVVVKSLGSSVALSALLKQDSTKVDTVALYLLSHQWSLVGGALRASEEGSSPASDGANPAGFALQLADSTDRQAGHILEVFANNFKPQGRIFQGDGEQPHWLEVTAFTDPNDLLSYPLPDILGANMLARNVYVKNRVFAVPGFVVSPTTHNEYDSNKALIKFMVTNEGPEQK